MKIKRLPLEFGSDGFKFTQIKRHGDAAVYLQQKDNLSWYETVKIFKRRSLNPDFDMQEHYPASEDWGICGFTFYGPDQAEKKMEEIRDKRTK